MAEKPTLLLIGPTPPPYHGVAVATRMLLESTLRERFTLAHLDISDRRGIQHVDHPDFHDVALFLRQWIRLLVILLRQRPNLVYIPVSQSTVGFLRDSLLMWPARLVGSRVVFHLHGGNFRAWYEGRSWGLRAYVRSVLKRVERVVVLGESLKGVFSGLVPCERIAVVPNGITWSTSAPSEPSVARTRRYRVLHVGTLSRHKGALVLVAAIHLVEAVRQDVEFVFAGSWANPEDQRAAESFIARQGLANAVSFRGVVDGEAKRELFESSDLFVFPGIQQEGQPLVVLEAKAAALPVIFTNRGCLRETVAEAGLEVEIGDPRSLASRMMWLLDRPQERRRMGAEGRNRYETLYTSDRFVERMTRLFISVVGEAA